eukprot:764299-Hanusia_phi.AAC.1
MARPSMNSPDRIDSFESERSSPGDSLLTWEISRENESRPPEDRSLRRDALLDIFRFDGDMAVKEAFR